MPVSVVIIAGGALDDLFECLLSLRELAARPREIIVMDNSPGGLGEPLVVTFPWARVIRAQRLCTFAEAANFALRAAFAAGARSALLLNDDVTVESDALEHLTAGEDLGGAGLYAPEVWPYESGAARARYRIDWAKRLIVRETPEEMESRYPDYAEASAVLISAEVFERLGGFDEELGFYYEDADFSVRARDAGFPVREVPGARVWHKGSVSAGKGLSPFKAYWRARNALKFAGKHRARGRFAANAFYHFAGFVLPEGVRAAARAALGSRGDAQVLAGIVRGTWDYLTGNGHITMPRPCEQCGPRAVPLLRELA